MHIKLIPKNINKNNFIKYGNIISTNKNKSKIINNGYAKNYEDLAEINTNKYLGKTKISIFHVKQRKFPMQIEMLEKHPFSSQLFFPIKKCYFIVVVAPRSKVPNIKKIESFIIPPNIGINYKTGIWHYPLIATIKSDFIVIDRKGPKKNLEIYHLNKLKILLDYE